MPALEIMASFKNTHQMLKSGIILLWKIKLLASSQRTKKTYGFGENFEFLINTREIVNDQ